MKINPLGKVPAITYQGQPVIESMTICEFLNDLLPDNKLMPDDAYARARGRNLIEMCSFKFMSLFYRMLVRRYGCRCLLMEHRHTRTCTTSWRA